jgi:hypothetical protein
MKTTKPENVQRLIEHLKSLPDGDSLGLLGITLMNNASQDHPTCGTVGCIAGEAYMLMHGVCLPPEKGAWPIILLSATDYLGLDPEEARSVFFVHAWPERLRWKARMWQTPAGRFSSLSAEREFMIARLEMLLTDTPTTGEQYLDCD